MNDNTIDKLKAMKPKSLNDFERERVWNGIHKSLAQEPEMSGFSLLLKTRPMIPVLLAIIIFLGGSVATVAAADNAKPGDLLFPLDRAIENIQISLSSDDKKDELKVKFAIERVEEIEEVIQETDNHDSKDDGSNQLSATSTGSADNNEASSGDQARLEAALNMALDYIGEVKKELLTNGNTEAAAAIDQVVERLNVHIQDLPSKLKLEVKSGDDKNKIKLEAKTQSGKEKFEFQSEGDKSEFESESNDGKTKIKIEDNGRIKIEHEDNEDDDEDKSGLSKVEAKIFTDQTRIKIEFDNKKHIITATTTDRDRIIDAVVDQFDVTREEVEQIIKIENEDHPYGGSSSGNNATSIDEDFINDSGDDDSDDDSNDDSKSRKQDEEDEVDKDETASVDDASEENFDPSPDEDEQSDNSEVFDSGSDLDTGQSDGNATTTSLNINSQNLREAEAETEGGRTKVKVKIGEQEDEYFLNVSDRDGVIDDIVNRYGLDRSIVDQKLKYKVESAVNTESE